MKFFSVIFLWTVTSICFAQNKPVPAYLLTQKLPDSVANFSLSKVDETTQTFQQALDQYNGKKIVIDIWASWCRDCLQGMPKIKKVQKQTNSDQVVYLFLSLDQKIGSWKKAIKRFKIQGEHYRIPQGWKNPISHYINLDWIPRYMVFDESGNIILGKAITIEDPKLLELISK